MAQEKKSVGKKLAHAGGWQIVKRTAKSIPPFGTVLAIGLVGYDIKKKGLVGGVVNSGLDAIPFLGLAKNAVELFRGDFIPDKDVSKKKNGR